MIPRCLFSSRNALLGALKKKKKDSTQKFRWLPIEKLKEFLPFAEQFQHEPQDSSSLLLSHLHVYVYFLVNYITGLCSNCP